MGKSRIIPTESFQYRGCIDQAGSPGRSFIQIQRMREGQRFLGTGNGFFLSVQLAVEAHKLVEYQKSPFFIAVLAGFLQPVDKVSLCARVIPAGQILIQFFQYSVPGDGMALAASPGRRGKGAAGFCISFPLQRKSHENASLLFTCERITK